jgi:hypothetical protein
MPHTCVEFDFAVFVRQTAVADGYVLRIIFININSGNDGIERIRPGAKQLHCFFRSF